MNHKIEAYEKGQHDKSQGIVYSSPVSNTRDLTTTSDNARRVIQEEKDAYQKGRDDAAKNIS